MPYDDMVILGRIIPMWPGIVAATESGPWVPMCGMA